MTSSSGVLSRPNDGGYRSYKGIAACDRTTIQNTSWAVAQHGCRTKQSFTIQPEDASTRPASGHAWTLDLRQKLEHTRAVAHAISIGDVVV